MLTIDIGNTCLKWGVWEKRQLVLLGAYKHHSVFNEALFDQCVLELDVKSGVNIPIYVSNVAGSKAEQGLRQWASARQMIAPEFLKVEAQRNGVSNGYLNPEQYGVDRWAALIGARSLCKSAVCVIDMGTAVTVDFMNKMGVHEGGIIMPGLVLMLNSLQENTSDILVDQTAFEQCTSLYANNTHDAVHSGTLNLLRAGLQDVIEQAANLYGDALTIMLTGGLAKQMMPLLRSSQMTYEPHLVLKGLHFAATN